MMFAHPKEVPVEVINREKKFLQAEYSPPSSPITSQHQQQQQQQQSFICVTMQVHTVLQNIIIIIIT